jgi:hypothetical protein
MLGCEGPDGHRAIARADRAAALYSVGFMRTRTIKQSFAAAAKATGPLSVATSKPWLCWVTAEVQMLCGT